jgi:hypothetical protein
MDDGLNMLKTGDNYSNSINEIADRLLEQRERIIYTTISFTLFSSSNESNFIGYSGFLNFFHIEYNYYRHYSTVATCFVV